jgi:hypothetical protein
MISLGFLEIPKARKIPMSSIKGIAKAAVRFLLTFWGQIRNLIEAKSILTRSIRQSSSYGTRYVHGVHDFDRSFPTRSILQSSKCCARYGDSV